MALLPRHSAGRGGEMRLLALAVAVLLARAPAPGKRGGTGRLGDPGVGLGWRGPGRPGLGTWDSGLAGRPRRLRAAPSRSPSAPASQGLSVQAAELSGASGGSGCRVPSSLPSWLGPQRSAGPSAAQFSPRGQASKWKTRAGLCEPRCWFVFCFLPSSQSQQLLAG